MSKGGSTTSTVAVPEYIEDAARRNLTEADKIRGLGFIPEYGPTVAAFTPMQEAAFQGTADLASAFGTPGRGMSMQDISGGMPAPTTYAGGVRGYSALPIYEQALEAFGQARPGQKRYAESFFIDPVTGLPGSNMQAPVDYTVASTPGDLGGIGGGDDPYFPSVAPPVTPQVDVPFTIPPVIEGPYVDDLTDGFDDSLSANTPVLTTDDLRVRMEEEERLRQEDAQRRADELTARANANPDLAGLDNSIFLQNQLEGGSSVNTGSYLPGFSAEETNAAAFDPRGPNQIPGSTSTSLFTGGGADAVGNFGQVGDFFGGIGDALGITDYSGTGGGLLGGLNVTGPPVENKVTSYSHSTDNDKPPGPGDTGWEQDRLLESLQGGGTGIIYKDDRREVYLDGVLIGNPKSADSAKKMLREAKEEKAAAAQPFTLPADTSTSAGMEVRALPNGTEYFVDASGNFAGLK